MTRAIEDHTRRPMPATLLRAFTTKKEISDAIELLIARLDAMDGDCDFEEDEIEDDAAESGIADWDGLDEQFGRAVV